MKSAVSARLGPNGVARVKAVAARLPASARQTQAIADNLELRLRQAQNGTDRLRRRNARLEDRLIRLRQEKQQSRRAIRQLKVKVKNLQEARRGNDARQTAATVLTATAISGGADLSMPLQVRPHADGGVAFHERLAREIKDPAVACAMVELLVDAGQTLVADEVAKAHGVVAALPVRYLRAMSRDLRLRGFLVRGLAYAQEAAKSGKERDVVTLAFRRGEIEVLSGAFKPSITMDRVEGTPNRVLHVVGFALPGKQSGYTIRTHYTAVAQLQAGLEPHVVTQMGIGGGESEAEPMYELDGISYHRLLGPARSELALSDWLQAHTEQLARVVESVKPSVLHAHSDFLNAVSAQTVGDAAGIPVVYESRGFWEESWWSRTSNEFTWPAMSTVEQTYGLPEAYFWRKEREAEARSRAMHVVTLAQVMADRIRDAGIDDNQISVVPNAVDTDAFPQLERNARLAAELGIADDELVIGYISSLVEYEGIDTLLEAYSRTRQSSSRKLRLLLVGDGVERARLEELAEALGAEGVVFTGQVPHEQVLAYYSLIDIFVVPRRPADVCRLVTPLKPFEAFSTARTVVLSDVEALREIAQESDAAALFKAGDALSLAEVLESLIDTESLRTDLAVRGAEWVRATRTWAANASAYSDIYSSLPRL